MDERWKGVRERVNAGGWRGKLRVKRGEMAGEGSGAYLCITLQHFTAGCDRLSFPGSALQICLHITSALAPGFRGSQKVAHTRSHTRAHTHMTWQFVCIP